MRHVTHQKHQADFLSGREKKLKEVAEMGWEKARDKFNLIDYPSRREFDTLAAYYRAQGELEALWETM